MAPDGTDTQASLSRELQECAQALASKQRDGAPLRKLQNQLQKYIVRPVKVPYRTTIAFILDQWIKDYYFNFAGDVVSSAWPKIDEIQEKLLSIDVSAALLELSKVSDGAPADAVTALEKLVVSYLNAIEQANKEADSS